MSLRNIAIAASITAAAMIVTACQQPSAPERTTSAPTPQPTAPSPPTEPKFVRPTTNEADVDGNLVNSACFIAAINKDPAPERFEAKEGAKIGLEGWTADVDFNVPESVAIVIRSSSLAYEYPATLGPDRSRAAEILKKPQLANAGYAAELDLSGVQPGEYALYIRQTTGSSKKYCLIAKRRLVVGG